MTMLNRTDPQGSPSLVFTDIEIAVLDKLPSSAGVMEFLPRTLSHYLTAPSKLGGYLAHKGDPPPGNTVMWRGLTRLTDLDLGMQIAQEVVGN